MDSVQLHDIALYNDMSVDQKWIAPSPKFSIFFFLHSYVLWDETRHFLPQLALCCDCVRCY